MSELPNGWVELSFKDVINKISVNNLKIKQRDYLDEGALPVIDQGEQFIGGYTDDLTKKIECKKPIIVFGDHTKAIKYITFDFAPGADGVKIIAPFYELFEPKLFYYFMFAIKLPDKGYARHFQYLEKSQIPLPPLSEQKRIVEKIEALFSRLDAGIAALGKTKVLLNRYKQSVLKAAFEGSLIKSDCVWQQRNLSDCCIKITDGTHHSPVNKPSGDYKYITAKNIKEYSLDLDNMTYISKKDHDEIYSRCDVKYRDVLYIKDGATTGRACLNTLNEEYSLLSSVCVLRPDENILLPEFLTFFLNSRIARDEMFKNIAGVAITRLTLKKIKSSKIQVPNVLIQRQIITEIEKLFSVADKALETVEQELRKAQALKSKILEYAFTGKLVPQNPDDEPADKLLERIKAEKEASKPTKKTIKRK